MRASLTIATVVIPTLFAVGCTSTSSPTLPSSAPAPIVGASSPRSGNIGAFSIGTGIKALSDPGGATVISIQTPCHFFDGDGNWTLAIGDCDFHIVGVPGGEIVNLTARGQVPPASNSQAVHFDFGNTGIACVIENTPYSTTDWQESVSPSGQVEWYCRFR